MGCTGFQKRVTPFAVNSKAKNKKTKLFLLFKEEGLNVRYEPTLSQVSGRGSFPPALL